MLASATFQGAHRAIRLLDWLVAETLAGREARIKEFTVGVDALGRGDSFDPRQDATARVEAHRLRTRIDLYYAKEGMADPVRISLPRGSYVPRFAAVESSFVAPAKTARAHWMIAAGIAALAIVGATALNARWFSGDEPARARVHHEPSAEAQRLYSQGIYYLRKPTREGIDRAIGYLGRAMAVDPGFAQAYVKLANAFILKGVDAGPAGWMPSAEALVRRAIDLDGNLAEAHALQGFIAWVYRLDRVAAERALAAALALDPESIEAHYAWARLLADTGHPEPALVHARHVTRNSPLSPYDRKREAYVLLLARRYDEAIAAYRDLIELEPDFMQTQRELGLAYEEKGQFAEALAQFRRVEGSTGLYAAAMIRADIARSLALSGARGEATAMLASLVREAGKGYVSSYDIATVYAGLGMRDDAIHWLDRATRERPFWLSLIKVDPRLDDLRADPRFEALQRQLRL